MLWQATAPVLKILLVMLVRGTLGEHDFHPDFVFCEAPTAMPPNYLLSLDRLPPLPMLLLMSKLSS